ncbi:MAG: formate dehydrogenase accessory sulfurtransferase FdhD [Pseudomonadales bacterium]
MLHIPGLPLDTKEQETGEHSLVSSPQPFLACSAKLPMQRWHEGEVAYTSDEVAEEVAVALSYNGISHVVMMASPSDLEDFALGFSLSEGILHLAEELYDIEIKHHCDGIEVAMTIASQRLTQLKQQRRNLTGRTGCGLCGAESLQQAIRPARAVPLIERINHQAVQRAAAQIADRQQLRKLTGAAHGAAWCDSKGEIILLREDVGRHNALDKLIGALQVSGLDAKDGFVLVTSRASYEMVQKTCAAGIPLLVAVSAPTALAIRLAESAGLSLVGFTRTQRHVVYCDASASAARRGQGKVQTMRSN